MELKLFHPGHTLTFGELGASADIPIVIKVGNEYRAFVGYDVKDTKNGKVLVLHSAKVDNSVK